MLGWLLLGVLAVLPSPGPEVRKYLRVSTPRAILEHVQVIDGTGARPLPDRNIVIENGKIAAITPGADETASEGATVLDLRGYTVLPGIVGMHDHLFYLARPGYGADGSFSGPALFQQMTFSATRLYLANGVTTMRTAGSIEPQAGDPAARITDIEKVEIVFQDGLGYDSRKLLDSVEGRYGLY